MLEWHLKYSARVEWFEQIKEEGANVDFLEDQPTLYPDLYNDWQAFWQLSGSRQIGMGLGNIQISEILAYMKMFQINDIKARTLLLTRIQILDRYYLKHHSEEQKKKTRKKGKK